MSPQIGKSKRSKVVNDVSAKNSTLIRGMNLPRIGDFNQTVVLDEIRRSKFGVSRVDVIKKTGLSPQTVSNICRRLLDLQLIEEIGKEQSGPGKPRILLRHNFSYILQVGSNISDAIRTGYAMNVPLREIGGVASDEVTPLFRLESGSVIVEATKLAEDGSGDLIVRCYESQGVRSHLVLTPSFEVKDVVVTDSLERQKHGHVELVEGNIGLEFTPFQLRTIRITRK